MNILINSNFLLKLIEWQTESSLFTIRIRGKQWYWVYKYDVKDISDIFSAPKNVGRNKWVVNNYSALTSSDLYVDSLKLRAQNNWFKKYWSELSGKISKTKSFKYKSSISEGGKKNLYNYDSSFLQNSLSLDNSFFFKKKFKYLSKDSVFFNYKDSLASYKFRPRNFFKSVKGFFFEDSSSVF